MIKTTFDLKQSQHLAMTPRLQQAIKLLQMSHLELNSFVNQQLEDNPLLIKDGDDYDTLQDNYESFEQFDSDDPESLIFEDNKEYDPLYAPRLKTEPTLQEHVFNQWKIVARNDLEFRVGECLIDLLNPDGYITSNLTELATRLLIPESLVLAVLKQLQHLDPVGIFARNLSECMQLQLLDRGELTKELDIFLEHLDMLTTHGIDKLAKACHQSIDVIQSYLRKIRTLTPKPGLQFSKGENPVVIVDIIVKKSENNLYPELNPDAVPKVFANSNYFQELKNKCRKGEELQYLNDQMSHANWLVNALEQRSVTLLRVSQAILKFQKDFFEKGVCALKPLSLKEIAEAVDMHESTISRVTTDKYIETPLGIFDLKFFFSSKITTSTKANNQNESVSSKHIMELIRTLVGQEEPRHPLSDDNIATLLQSKGYNVARRTIAKYRGILNLGSSTERKHMNAIRA
jgi:RNA polymerase sigma-54 factor